MIERDKVKEPRITKILHCLMFNLSSLNKSYLITHTTECVIHVFVILVLVKRSLASSHLMEVFTGSSNHTRNTESETVELKLKDVVSPSANNTLKDMVQYTPLP